MDNKLYCKLEQNFHETQYPDYQDSQDKKEDSCEVKSPDETNGDTLIISLVHDHPYLYNKDLIAFKDNIKKQNAWIEIANILNMTPEECQLRWTRLRERYTREKKQRQEEASSGNAVSNKKPFEYFENMKFLEPFVKRRRRLTNMNMKNTLLSTKYVNLQKNSVVYGGKENSFSCVNTAASVEQPLRSIGQSSKNIGSEQNQFRVDKKQKNIPSMNVITLVAQSSRDNDIDLEQNQFKVSSGHGNQINVSSANADTLLQQSLMDNMNLECTDSTHPRDVPSGLHAHVSDISSASSSSDDAQNKTSIRQRKLKRKSQPDILQNAICEIVSLLKNRYSSTVTLSSSLKPEVEEDVAFCQLILSLFTKLPLDKKIEKKKEILRIMYDM